MDLVTAGLEVDSSFLNRTVSQSNSTTKISPVPLSFTLTNIIVRLLEGVLACGGNSLTIFAIYKFPNLHTCTNYIITVLAVADFCGGLNSILLFLNAFIHMTIQNWLITCVVEQLLSLASSMMNVYMIFIIAVDRFVYINQPLHYHLKITPKTVVVMTTVGLLITLTLLILSISYGVQPNPQMVCRASDVFVALERRVFPGLLTYSFYVVMALTILLHGRIAWVAYQAGRQSGPVSIQELRNFESKFLIP